MPALNENLHGNVPDTAEVALLLIDVINDLEFPEGDQLLRYARAHGRADRRAEATGQGCGHPGDLRQRQLRPLAVRLQHAGRPLPERRVRGQPLAELLRPDEDDYFVLKPKHSGFFSTTLDILLDYLQVKSLILTGIAANICVLFTANDAYMRDFRLFVPRDCVASNTEEDNRDALEQMQLVLKADIRPSDEIDLAALGSRSR